MALEELSKPAQHEAVKTSEDAIIKLDDSHRHSIVVEHHYRPIPTIGGILVVSAISSSAINSEDKTLHWMHLSTDQAEREERLLYEIFHIKNMAV